MTKSKQDKLLQSNYDGIEEYDNDLPKWWIYSFYITIVFSVIYVGYYEFGPGKSPHQLLSEEMAQLESLRAQVEVSSDQGEDLSTLVQEPARIALGKEVFATKCLACHGASGEGLIGPNLTDGHTIHGGSVADIQKVIENGVLEKGMLAWKSQLSSDELIGVISFVWSIRNNNVPGKAPEGDPIGDS